MMERGESGALPVTGLSSLSRSALELVQTHSHSVLLLRFMLVHTQRDKESEGNRQHLNRDDLMRHKHHSEAEQTCLSHVNFARGYKDHIQPMWYVKYCLYTYNPTIPHNGQI